MDRIEKVIDKFLEKYLNNSFEYYDNEIFIEGKELGLDFLEEQTEEEQEETKRKIAEGLEKKGFKINFVNSDSYFADIDKLVDEIIKDGFL